MDDKATSMATKGKYVVCNVNYRLLGDQENTDTLNNIAGDLFGSLL